MKVTLFTAMLIVAAASSAFADPTPTIWQRAIASTDESAAKGLDYADNMRLGDDYVENALSPQTSSSVRRSYVEHAILAYHNASIARPDAAEAHYRAGMAGFTFFVECHVPTGMCNPGRVNLVHARQVLDDWEQFSKLAPLDPRATAIMFNRAILHTKMANPKDMKLALDDYTTLLSRVDIDDGLQNSGTVQSNLAETYMMLGDLEGAITSYRAALREHSSASTAYGLAVALDRDGQGRGARELARDQGLDAFQGFVTDIEQGHTFFVPAGEENYYFALVEESFGRTADAIDHYRAFLRSGAYPQYQPRAQANLDALLKKSSHP